MLVYGLLLTRQIFHKNNEGNFINMLTCERKCGILLARAEVLLQKRAAGQTNDVLAVGTRMQRRRLPLGFFLRLTTCRFG